MKKFQSTLPVRGATVRVYEDGHEDTISIHAPRAGSDIGGNTREHKDELFQSTLPVRGATQRRLTKSIPR